MWVHGDGGAYTIQTSLSYNRLYVTIILSNGTRYIVSTALPSLNTWHFIMGTYNGTTLTSYVDGNKAGSISISGIIDKTSYSSSIGGIPGNIGDDVIGQYADAQIYNTSLSANEVQALYQEGIGGAPIDLQNIVGWWPLNGNANDYSGNNYNGQASNVIYTSSWTSGYSAP